MYEAADVTINLKCSYINLLYWYVTLFAQRLASIGTRGPTPLELIEILPKNTSSGEVRA